MITKHLVHSAPPNRGLTRRQLLRAGGALALTWLTGCAGDASPDAGMSESPTDPTSDFPARIEHKFGVTQIPREPQRVVTVGATEHDPVLALGVAPVGVARWFGDEPYAVWPWAIDLLGDATPQVRPIGELNFEAIAALDPDLIVGTNSGMSAGDYATLGKIAPTLAQAGEYGDFETPWREETRSIARALGRPTRAEELIAAAEAHIARAAASLAKYAGAEVVMSNGGPGKGQVYVYKAASKNGQLLEALGLDVPAELDQAGTSMVSAQAILSTERLDLLDRDLLLWNLGKFGDRESVESLATYDQLEVVRKGRDVFIEDEKLYAAVAFNTVLSIPFALDRLVPMLRAVLEEEG